MEFNKEEARELAKSCLSCKNPSCEQGCPINNHIRDFIKAVKDDNFSLAADIIYENSDLPFICSIVCPHEKHCEGHCILNKAKKPPVAIGKIEAIITHNVQTKVASAGTNRKSALVVGSGPGGITAALRLAKAGFKVDMYEAENHIGGVLTYGIPNYRLENAELERISDLLKQYGVQVSLNKYVTEKDILALKSNYDAIILACGLTQSKNSNLGDSKYLIDATKFLKQYNYYTRFNEGTMPELKGKVVIVGAGNVAMDAARVARRLNLEVEIVYRRTRQEAPAVSEEIEAAISEGVKFSFLENPVEIITLPKHLELKIEQMALGEPDSSGRRRPVGTGKYIYKEANYVIAAIGQDPDLNLDFKEINTDYGFVEVDDNFETNVKGIYAIGDLTLGARTVVEASASAKKAVNHILYKVNRI